MSDLSIKYFHVCFHAHVADLMTLINETSYNIQHVVDWVLFFSYRCVLSLNKICPNNCVKMHSNVLLSVVSLISVILYLI